MAPSLETASHLNYIKYVNLEDVTTNKIDKSHFNELPITFIPGLNVQVTCHNQNCNQYEKNFFRPYKVTLINIRNMPTFGCLDCERPLTSIKFIFFECVLRFQGKTSTGQEFDLPILVKNEEFFVVEEKSELQTKYEYLKICVEPNVHYSSSLDREINIAAVPRVYSSEISENLELLPTIKRKRSLARLILVIVCFIPMCVLYIYYSCKELIEEREQEKRREIAYLRNTESIAAERRLVNQNIQILMNSFNFTRVSSS